MYIKNIPPYFSRTDESRSSIPKKKTEGDSTCNI